MALIINIPANRPNSNVTVSLFAGASQDKGQKKKGDASKQRKGNNTTPSSGSFKGWEYFRNELEFE